MSKYILIALLALSFHQISAQDYVTKTFNVPKKQTVSLKNTEPEFNVQLNNLEAPKPDGDSYRAFLMRQKIASAKKFPRKVNNQKNRNSGLQPIKGKDFGLKRKLNNGNWADIGGGIPNDNTLAISDSGIVLVGINSLIYAYDLKNDSILFPNYTRSLTSIGGGSAVLNNYYDPKVIYDEVYDRFILVFLKNNDPATNKYLICFSLSNNPIDGFHVYELPGNPLNNNRWTDFPVISHTKEEVFLSGNLIIPGVSWQVGFDGSIIWQINKEKGYNGEADLMPRLYSDIKYNGRFTRNLHLVQGAKGAAETQYVLSNRNFDIVNDTVFVMKITGPKDDTNTVLEIKATRTNLPYGVPPNGRQFDTDPNDPTTGLQTNDARVLGAILINDKIQYVANSINTATGFSAIYHGFIEAMDENPIITGNLIADPVLDFGYPNIAFSGNEDCDIETIIAFNYTSTDSFPGIATVAYNNDGNYSSLMILKAGENYVNRLNGGYERWGDYFGLQRWHANPGKVVSAGFYGLTSKGNGTWVNELMSPDPDKLANNFEVKNNATFCKAELIANVSGGVAPYKFFWNNSNTEGTSNVTEVCKDVWYKVKIEDARGCYIIDSTVVKTQKLNTDGVIYPNPFVDQVALQFNLDTKSRIKANIYDLDGKLVYELVEKTVDAGLNELVFSLEPLKQGVYFLRVFKDDKEFLTKKIIKTKN